MKCELNCIEQVRVSNVCYPNRTALGKKSTLLKHHPPEAIIVFIPCAVALFIDKHLNYALRHRPDKFHSMVSQPEIVRLSAAQT